MAGAGVVLGALSGPTMVSSSAAVLTASSEFRARARWCVGDGRAEIDHAVVVYSTVTLQG